MMNIREIKPINFLFFRTQTTVSELSNYLHIARDLYREAIKLDLLVSGPVHWHYFGFTGDYTQPFTLEIALPVDRVVQDYDGAFHFKRTELFKCASLIHEGNWLELPGSYAKLMAFITEKGLNPVAANRELYVNADFQYPEANTTEVQIGVQ
jgi:effector-binding domain-containing protein